MDTVEEVTHLKYEIFRLKQQLSKKEEELRELKTARGDLNPDKLSNEDISKYSRQIILSQIGVSGQIKLKKASVLVVGAGGLGCPALMYLASAGVGNLGIVDYDVVEENNLHRQILHTENTLNIPKVCSAQEAVLRINSNCNVTPFYNHLDNSNAVDIISGYDIILDCSDNVATRYLLNDACIFARKPLVSGSALQLEGQLTVYNYKDGPCYRCLFPKPPPSGTVSNCGDVGVLGAITGVIGSLQALEAMKIILEMEDVVSGRLLIFDGSKSLFRNIRIRRKRDDCDVCSEKPIITHLIDYEQFCGMRASDKDYCLELLPPEERISVEEYRNLVTSETPHVLIDVRSEKEFEICKLDNSVNIPIKDILNDKGLDGITKAIEEKQVPVIIVCRRGNDSQIVVHHLRQRFGDSLYIKDIIGGLHSWHRNIESTFPIY